MDWVTTVGISGAESLIGFLASHFKVRKPKLNVGYRGTSGRYSPFKRQITLGKDCKAWAVAHEFAHFLVHINRIPPRPKNGDPDFGSKRNVHYSAKHGYWHGRKKEESHSQSFYNTLRLVINAAGDADKYPWGLEYKQLKRWAIRDGLYKEPVRDEVYKALYDKMMEIRNGSHSVTI